MGAGTVSRNRWGSHCGVRRALHSGRGMEVRFGSEEMCVLRRRWWDQGDGRAAVREGLWRARRLPPFVARRPNLLSYLRRLRLRVASAAV